MNGVRRPRRKQSGLESLCFFSVGHYMNLGLISQMMRSVQGAEPDLKIAWSDTDGFLEMTQSIDRERTVKATRSATRVVVSLVLLSFPAGSG